MLTIDSDLQAVGEAQMSSFGLPGAFVAMDANNGEILALGSNPTFDPSILAQPEVTTAESRSIYGDPDDEASTGAPAFNRAIAGGYPTGSTFKPITALGGPRRRQADDVGGDRRRRRLRARRRQRLHNAGDAVFGPIQLREALQFSSDVFFYTLGGRCAEVIDDDEWIQDWATQPRPRRHDRDRPPGRGRRAWCRTRSGATTSTSEGLTDRPWSFGDNVNLSVGQGDLQADPLQMAVAYAAIGNGGTVVTPHVGLRAEDPAGRIVQEIEPAPRREIDIDPGWRSAIMDGLTAAAMEPAGTSYPVFGDPASRSTWPARPARRRPTQGDQSWYVALAPADDPKVVVAFTFERGGFGADTAAPAARALLTEYAQKYLSVNEREFERAAEASPGEAGTVVLE